MYEVILTIHIATAVSLIAVVLFADHLAFLWVRGKHEVLPAPQLKLLHRLVYGGLIIMLPTGLYMFWPLQEYLLSTPAFLIKMSLVVTLIINSVFIGRFIHVATEKPFAMLRSAQRVPLLISGAISSIAWLGTIVAATQLGL